MKFLLYGLAAVGAVYFLYRLLQASSAAATPNARDRGDKGPGPIGGDATYYDTSSSVGGHSHHGHHSHSGSSHDHGDAGSSHHSGSDHGGSDTGFDSGGGGDSGGGDGGGGDGGGGGD